MNLEEKGPIVPPPVLPHMPQMAAGAVQAWEGIVSATHWDLYKRDRPDGADFYAGADELGHIHLDGAVHLAAGKPIATALVDAGLAAHAPFGGSSGWVVYPITSEAGAQHATWLFRLNYDRLKGTPTADLLERIKQQSISTLD